MGSQLLTINEAAERVRRPTRTLRYWRQKGTGPESFRLGRRVMYDAQALERWIEEQRRHRDISGATPATGAATATATDVEGPRHDQNDTLVARSA